MKLRNVRACALLCLLTMAGMWGCGSKEPTEVEKKKELAGEPGKSFDPSSVPAQYKAGFEKWQKSNGAKVSGPVSVTGPPPP